MDARSALPTVTELNARISGLVRRAQQLPPPGARPLTVATRVAGWVTAQATDLIATLPGVHVEYEAVHLGAVPSQRLTLNAVLENIAVTLRDAGVLRSWRDELLDVMGEGRLLGRIERAAVRPLGMLTQAVHLNAWSPDGRLWIARRALDKSTGPGMWDTLAGGLAGAGEDLETALLRESHEEAGLLAVDLAAHQPLRTVLRMHRRLPEGYQVENLLLCDCVLDAAATPTNLDGEVTEIRCVPIAELWEMLCQGRFTLEADLAILDSLRLRAAGVCAPPPVE
ncbi:NUDIX domain-containing protein [Alcaligenaceae bacterium CGII-47]|nr:NUDIX domain-containing protein [Alcaligenaceae bacterium CGII-47]